MFFYSPSSLRTMRGLPLLLLSVLLLTGCDLFGSDDDDDPRLITTGVVVGNGGNFGDQNGFVTVYDPATGTTADMANLSGFVNSIAVRGTRVYALLNTFSTGRIDVLDLDLDLDQAARVAQIQDVPIPRYMDFLNDTKAYVTNLNFAGKGFVNVLDLTTNTVVGDPIEVDLNRVSSLATGFAFQIWPNPATQQLEVRGLPNGQETIFRVWASDGQLVKTGDWLENQMDVSDLQPGLYLLQFVVDGKLGTHPFVKQ